MSTYLLNDQATQRVRNKNHRSPSRLLPLEGIQEVLGVGKETVLVRIFEPLRYLGVVSVGQNPRMAAGLVGGKQVARPVHFRLFAAAIVDSGLFAADTGDFIASPDM